MTNNKDGCILAQNNQPSSSKKKIGSKFDAPKTKDNEGDHNYEKMFRKGPWTPEEDALLIEYVKKHGERHWNCVQKTGLMRCGKSCRLRWTNHLRPDLKKGVFSPEEERIVLDFHAKLGNKWSKIAAELPGRTDNEVKNFWNTKIKRRMKVNQLMRNSQLNHPKEIITYHQYLQQQNVQSQISRSNLKGECEGKPCENIIRSSELNDPILSFLNNPAYKFPFLSQEENISYDFGKGFSLPLNPPNYGLMLPQSSCNQSHTLHLESLSSNNVFAKSSIDPSESIINNNNNNDDRQCGSYLNEIWEDSYVSRISSTRTKSDFDDFLESTSYVTMEQPSAQINCQQIHNFGMVGIDYGVNDSWLSSLMGRNSNIEKPSTLEEQKCVLDETALRDDAKKMETLLGGHKRLMDNHGVVFCNNGIKRLKVEPLEELMPTDDDLFNLLHDLSCFNSPTSLTYASNEASMPNYKETFELPILPAAIAPSTTSTSEFKCNNMDDYWWNKDTLHC